MQKMNAWLLGLGLALLCTVHAEDDEPSDTVNEEGLKEGYVLGAATNHPKFRHYADKMPMTKVTYKKLEDGSLTASAMIPWKNQCKSFAVIFKKTEDGKYVNECEWGLKVLDIIYVAEDGSYSIVVATLKKEGQEPKVIVILLAKNPWLTPEMEGEFMKRVEEYGLTKDHIKTFPMSCTGSN
ncbi:extracellular fatty acid-binding protein-like [Anolis sagrei]|uniref:extracellular fatty acid-binding protein-like n=1 Tax=Anolis sagrei TaxID=38937 RepID=UPI0035218E16